MAEKHIMISYNWSTSDLADRLYTILTESGYRIWMDKKGGMGSNVLKSMGAALAGAAVVFALLNQKYEESTACQAEIETAFQQKIPLLFAKDSEYTPSPGTKVAMGSSKYYSFENKDGVHTFAAGMEASLLSDIAALIPPGHPAREYKQRRILVVGAAGIGKSSLVALLINKRVHPGDNNGIFVSSNIMTGSWNTTEVSNRDYIITDTMGIGAEDEKKELGTPTALENLKRFLINSRKGYHHIFLVVRLGRGAIESRQAYQAFYETLFPDMQRRFILVYTDFPETAITDEYRNYASTHFPGIPVIMGIDNPCIDPTDVRYAAVSELQDDSYAKVKAVLDRYPNMPVHVPAISMMRERSAFQELLRKIYKILGLQWNDQTATSVSALSFDQ